jgi:hypothetical protein
VLFFWISLLTLISLFNWYDSNEFKKIGSEVIGRTLSEQFKKVENSPANSPILVI